MLRNIHIEDDQLVVGYVVKGKFMAKKLDLNDPDRVRGLYKLLMSMARSFEKDGIKISAELEQELDGSINFIRFTEDKQ